jgi:integrase
MQRKPLRIGKIMPGSFAHVIRQFMASAHFQSKAKTTQDSWARVLRIAEEEGGLGGCSVQVIRPALIQGFLDALAHKPGQQMNARTALKAVEKFAVVRELVPYPFMTGTSCIGSDGGHEPWTFEQVTLAEQNARADLSRVITLAVETGQRGSDIVRMCWSDIEEKEDPTSGRRHKGINVIQKKTDVRLWVPLTARLEEVMAGWEKRPGPFVLKPDGKPYVRSLLSWHWNHERDNNESLASIKAAGLVLHGLRATAVVRARKAGANPLQIASMIGMSVPMVTRYSRLADQGEMAMAVVHLLDRTAGERKQQKIERFAL